MRIRNFKKIIATAIILLMVAVFQISFAAAPPGVTTAPYTVTYTAKLNDSGGNPITTAHTVRFSLWTDADYDGTDIDGAGNINVAAVGYAFWQEEHTVTPNADGIFTVQLGSVTDFPNFNSDLEKFLQVEVKADADLPTAYEVLDPDGVTTNTTDRKSFNSVPFAVNSDTLDNRDAGTDPGNIPFLNTSGLLNFDLLPGGSENETFILDVDNTIETAGTGSIILQFGDTLGKFLEYDLDAAWFNFNDDVNITGDLFVDGVDIGPSDQSLIYEAMYADSVISDDGTANRGKLEVFYDETDGVPGNDNYNFYKWTTRKAGPTLNDKDLVIRIKIPDGFISWQAIPIEFDYKTGTALAADNTLDVFVEDTTGASVALTGASSLVSATWATAPITFAAAPTVTAGDTITVKVRLSATKDGEAMAGRIKLNFFGT